MDPAERRLRRQGVALVVTRADRIGGAQVHVFQLARGLRARGIPVVVITGPPGPFTGALAGEGIPYRCLPWLVRPIRPLADLRALLALRALLRRLDPALVAAHSTKATWLARLAAASLGIPCVITVHGWTWTAGAVDPLPPAGPPRASTGCRQPGPLPGGGARREGGPGAGDGAGEGRGGGRKPKPAGRWLEHLARWGERLLSPLAAAVITVSAHDYGEGLRHGLFDPRRAVVIPNGVADPRQTRPGPGGGSPRSSTLRIVMVARFEPPKDHATLLRAVALLDGHGHLVDGPGPRGHPNHDWVVELAGDGPALPEAVALARRLGIDHRVRFRGACPHGAGAFQDAAVAVLCTRREGLPLAVLEAMAAGVPVVATAVGGVPEAVRHGVTGFLVPPGDPAAVARYLATLLADPALRRRMGAAARARYEAHYTVDRMVAATLAVYRAACAGRSPGAGGPRGTVW